MRDRGGLRARIFVGGFLLIAALLVWGTGVIGGSDAVTSSEDPEQVRTAAVIFQRNIAYATIALSLIAAILLFPARRPRLPKWDWAIAVLIVLLVGSSLYQLLWLRAAVAG